MRFGHRPEARKLCSLNSETSHFYDNTSEKRKLYSALTVSINSMLVGLNLGALGILDGVVENIKANILYVNGLFYLGVILGNFIPFFLKYNIKVHIIVSLVTFTIGQFFISGAISILKENLLVFILFGRFLNGIAIGNTCTTVPQYLFYVSPSNKKGVFGYFHNLGIMTGLFFSRLFLVLIPAGRECIFLNGVLIFEIIMIFCSLTILNVKNIRKGSQKTITELIVDQHCRRSLLLGIIIHIGYHLCGITFLNGILCNDLFSDGSELKGGTLKIEYNQKDLHQKQFYNEIFEKFFSISRERGTIFIYFISLLGALTGMYFIESFGRKRVLLVSIMICIISSIFLSIRKNMFLSIMSYFLGYSIGLGSIVWFIVPEMFTNEYETASIAVSTFFNWISFVICMISLPYLFYFIQHRIFMISTCSMVFLFFIILFLLTETKDRMQKLQFG